MIKRITEKHFPHQVRTLLDPAVVHQVVAALFQEAEEVLAVVDQVEVGKNQVHLYTAKNHKNCIHEQNCLFVGICIGFIM